MAGRSNGRLPYPHPAEEALCAPIQECLNTDALIIGAGIGMVAAHHAAQQALSIPGRKPRIVLVEAGPCDLLTHVGNTLIKRWQIFQPGPVQRVSGLLGVWGLVAAKPRPEISQCWPFDQTDLQHRFAAVEETMGVHDPLPMVGSLQSGLLEVLGKKFPEHLVTEAPIAVNRYGHRWSPLDDIAALSEHGVKLLARFRCTRLELTEDRQRVARVHGQWLDGKTYTINAECIALALGVKAALPLLAQVHDDPFETADHLRIDIDGHLPWNTFSDDDPDQQGIAVLLMQGWCQDVPYHVQIKIGCVKLWKQGFMPGSDTVQATRNDKDLYVQIQMVSAMHDRLPVRANARSVLEPMMSDQDGRLQGELMQIALDIAESMGLEHSTVFNRPLLTNFHEYGALRIGTGVTPAFRMQGVQNLWVLPPTAFPAGADSSNPTLTSVVLAQYAMEDIMRTLAASQ